MDRRIKNAIFIGIISFLLQGFDRLFVSNVLSIPRSGLVFISFIAWGSYSLVDIDDNKVFKSYVNFAIGFMVAITMILVGYWLSFANNLTSPLVALIVVPFVMLMDVLPKGIDKIPIYFIGSGVFFGLNNYLGFGFTKIFMIASIYVSVGLMAAKICDIYSERK